MRKTKIVCTIGPASENEKTFKELVLSGLNVARLNFSHGTHEEHKEKIEVIKKVRDDLGACTAIMLDTKGPEIRTKDFENGGVELVKDQEFIITTRDVLGTNKIASVTYEDFAKDVNENDMVLIDDGLIRLEVVEKINDTDLRCIVKNGGTVKNKKGVNVPNVKINLPALTERDIDDIMFGIENDVDYIAASFIRKAEDVISIRRILEDKNADNIMIISKIENRQGVENIDEIIEVSDGVMVARGDLGVEIPAEEVPLVQKMLIKKCNDAGKPVITATQMLDSMIRNPRPTRAEVSDVATAIFEGSDAIMLSGETASGSYPVESVQTMARVAQMIENSLDYEEILKTKNMGFNNSITDSISYATCRTCLDLKASAIISATSSGYTAAAVSKYRPLAPIIAATENEHVMRKMSIYWGVYPVKISKMHSTDEIIEKSVEGALELGYIENGDLIVITAGVPVGISGSTNLLKVHIVSELLYKTVGVGKETVIGRAIIAKNAAELRDKFEDGDIIVMSATGKDVIEYMARASAIIVEEGGLTSHAFIAGLNLGKEVVVGAENCIREIKDGEILTVNGKQGVVYRGQAKVM
ncbi:MULTISPECIES: pyruvate kinase [unclassified Sedimentibacter]|uniref:pyruvate kinase n=1 Tax=unclassified Sedimentibacter TaxID=2649220 RepID=UPI0027E154D2|nr:pyruvate kinase [Sedimentibacter sp. MB35-C1]WMJ76813.1 pyruvate kinase [Sedimentibacter sp. MB35-C1]